MGVRSGVRIVGLILALSLAGAATAQVAPDPPADLLGLIDALQAQSADETPAAEAAPVPPEAPSADDGPDIVSGVVVEAPSKHKDPLAAEEYAGGWNGRLAFQFLPPECGGVLSFPTTVHFGPEPSITINEDPQVTSRTPSRPMKIIWRLNGANIEIVIPKGEQWRAEDLEPPSWEPVPGHPKSPTELPQCTVWPDPPPPTIPRAWVLSGIISADGDHLAATFGCPECGPKERANPLDNFQTITMVRWGGSARPSAAKTALAADETRVSIDAGAGTLVGTYREPEGAAPGPAVLIVPGSGPVNGDGDSTVAGPGPSNLRLIAEALDAAGYRSLRFDKRGIGDSASAMQGRTTVKFGDVVDDTANWARYLAGQPRVTCVVLLGHSEGAMAAMLAAQKVPVCGLISLSGPGRPLGALIRDQMKRAGVSRAVQAQYESVLSSLEAGKPVASVPASVTGLQPAAQPYLMSQINLDPASLIQAVKAPVLILQGDNDIQVSVDDAKRLAAARPDAQLVIVRYMNNATKQATGTVQDNLDQALLFGVPLAKPVMPAVIDFLKQVKP